MTLQARGSRVAQTQGNPRSGYTSMLIMPCALAQPGLCFIGP